MKRRPWQVKLSRWTGGPPRSDKPTPAQAALDPRLPNPLLEELISRATFAGESQMRLQRYEDALDAVRCDVPASDAAERLEQERQRLESLPIQSSLGANAALLHALFIRAFDVVFRVMATGREGQALVIYLQGLVDEQILQRSVLDPLWRAGPDAGGPAGPGARQQGNESPNRQLQPIQTIGQAADAILRGDTVLLVDGLDRASRLATSSGPDRQVSEPPSEVYIRGPRDGFVESMQTNIALLRRRLRSPHLRIELFTMGRKSRTDVSLAYLEGVVTPEIVREVKRRLNRIDIDALQSSGMLEELLVDSPTSVFPLVLSTERPDRVSSCLLEGQVCIIVDGTSFVLVAPAVFVSFLTTAEDYYQQPWYGTIILWLRFGLMAISLIGPAFWVAVVTFHTEMLPTNLLVTVAAAREGVPFPALVETLLLDAFFEALREAGIRLPRAVGQAVSIVGALIIGDAVVRAGLASTAVIIVVATTGIASFTMPSYSLGISLRLLRFVMTLLGGMLGLVGLVLGVLAVLFHLCSLRSFGVPYLQPIAPFSPGDMKDSIFRLPIWLFGNRPVTFGAIDRKRQADRLRPGREEQGP